MKIGKIIYVILIGFLTACSDGNLLSNDLVSSSNDENLNDCLSKLSVGQIEKVSDIFWQNRILSRSSQQKEISSVETIKGKDNNPLIYIVNYASNGGYLIVSATRNYYPILAFSETGFFNYNQAPSYVKSLLSNQIDQIEMYSRSDTATIGRGEWLKYNIALQQKLEKKSRSLNTEYEIYDSIATDYILSWEDQKFGVMNLWAADDIARMWSPGFPKDILEDWIYEARTWYSLPRTEDLEFDYIIVEDVSPIEEKVLPVLTNWHQEAEFNYGLINGVANNNQPLVGCGPIAIGQVMKYFEWPNTYNWNAMANNYATDESRRLLKDIVKRGNVSFEGNAGNMNINETKSVLQSYGYSATLNETHNPSSVYNSLKNDNLVIMRGKDARTKSGHQWICHGYYVRYPVYKFSLMVLTKEKTGNIVMKRLGSYYDRSRGPQYSFNLEWGARNGVFNGVYLDQNIGLNTSEGYISYIEDRMDLINIKPNK